MITGMLSRSSNHLLAASYCADAIAASFARKADVGIDGLTVRASQRSESYRKLARELRQKAYMGAETFVGGRSQDTKDDRAADEDLVQPFFARGQDDFPGAAGSVSSSTS